MPTLRGLNDHHRDPPTIDPKPDNFLGRTIALVTGTLAEPALRRIAAGLAETAGVRPLVIVLNIQVAALMTAQWVSGKLKLPAGESLDAVVLPGYCGGDLAPLSQKLGVPVQRGPRDLNDLPAMFGQQRAGLEANAPFDIEIIAEINDAPRTPMDALSAEARQLSVAGADVIDLGCDPTTDRPAWQGVGDAVRALRDLGLRVSVDSFHVQEVKAACAAGADLVLSVNSTNVEAAADFGAAVVATPDTPQDLSSLDRTIERLRKMKVDFRVDPIIEPIGFGFAASLGRYIDVRRRHAQVPMMMGIGNLTEMTGVDSAGVNALLVGFCQELHIGSVLTTQVINWARSSVREIDLARRLMRFAVTEGAVPKHLDDRLVMLRDPKMPGPRDNDLKELAARLTDANVRIFADAHSGLIHAMSKHVHAADADPFEIFDKLGVQDPSHAFYLGYEMAKALTAITLGKNYVQDEALNWGFLTRAEASHYERRKAAPRRAGAEPGKPERPSA